MYSILPRQECFTPVGSRPPRKRLNFCLKGEAWHVFLKKLPQKQTQNKHKWTSTKLLSFKTVWKWKFINNNQSKQHEKLLISVTELERNFENFRQSKWGKTNKFSTEKSYTLGLRSSSVCIRDKITSFVSIVHITPSRVPRLGLKAEDKPLIVKI